MSLLLFESKMSQLFSRWICIDVNTTTTYRGLNFIGKPNGMLFNQLKNSKQPKHNTNRSILHFNYTIKYKWYTSQLTIIGISKIFFANFTFWSENLKRISVGKLCKMFETISYQLRPAKQNIFLFFLFTRLHN